MKDQLPATEKLSPWWRRSVLLVFVFGMAVLIFMSVQAYRYAPPIPESVVDSAGAVIFSRQDIESGQEVFLKYALMQNGSIWGHGSYLGPDFSAAYLHELALDTGNAIARKEFNADLAVLDADQRSRVDARVATLLKENRYDPATGQLKFLDAEKASYQRQRQFWADYFLQPTTNAGLPSKYIHDPEEIRQLTAFFAWTAWASVANRPDKSYSYTNNFPYDPMVGNLLTADSLLWSALSVAMLLAGLALVLFTFGRFDYLGWKGDPRDIHPHMLPGGITAGQVATIKYFLIVALLFLAQVPNRTCRRRISLRSISCTFSDTDRVLTWVGWSALSFTEVWLCCARWRCPPAGAHPAWVHAWWPTPSALRRIEAYNPSTC